MVTPLGAKFGKAIICSDAAAEAAKYGFTAVDRPEGFLVLAVASLGDKVTELKSPPEASWSKAFALFSIILVSSF